jgi:hypothetical protein
LFLCLTFLVCLDGGVWRERGRMVIFWKTMWNGIIPKHVNIFCL